MFKKKFVKNEEIETKTKDLVKAPYKYHFGWAIIIWDILLSCLIGTTGGVQKIENQKNPDGTTNYKAILEAFFNAGIVLVLFWVFFKLTGQI